MKAAFYTIEVNSINWTVPDRYEDLRYIDSGKFSYVCSAFDKKQETRVAIKKLKNGRSMIWIRIYREIAVLQHVEHENIVNLIDAFTPDNSFESFEEVYLVMPLMDKTLCSSGNKEIYSEDRVKIIMYQIFKALKYLHSANITHRDLKPTNIGVQCDDEIKILDLGLARYQSEEGKTMTAYVASRAYRAPEIVLEAGRYTEAVDIWSAGCIMTQLLTGKVLFRVSKDLQHLDMIFDLLGGCEDDEYISSLDKESAKYLNSQRSKPRIFENHFKDLSDSAVDFLTKVLEVNPARRVSAEQALNHQYFDRYHEVEDEPCSASFQNPLKHIEIQDNCPWKEKVWSLLQEVGSTK